RGIDGYAVLRNEIRGGRACDREQDRQRFDGQPMCEEREDHDEQTKSGCQIRSESGVIQSLALPEPFRELVDIDGVADDEQRQRVANAEADMRDTNPESRDRHAETMPTFSCRWNSDMFESDPQK